MKCPPGPLPTSKITQQDQYLHGGVIGVQDLFIFFFLGGGTHIFDMFCPNRRIHARIRCSPENLVEQGGGGGKTCTRFFALTKFSVFYSSIGIGGTCMHAPKIPDNIFWQASKQGKKKVARIFAQIISEFCSNFARFSPEFLLWQFFWFFFLGGAQWPPPPPSPTPMGGVLSWWVLLEYDIFSTLLSISYRSCTGKSFSQQEQITRNMINKIVQWQ